MNNFICNHSFESQSIRVGGKSFRFPQITKSNDKCICKYCNRDITDLYNSILNAYHEEVVKESMLKISYNYGKILKSQKAIKLLNNKVY